jgi:phosphohistidine phosphatase
MPKTLYLVRHAKSSWKHHGLGDSERPLNKRGKHDAPLMGKTLRNRGEIPGLLISSPAKRALNTAKLFAKEFNYPKEKIKISEILYMAANVDLYEVIMKCDDGLRSIMLFSHNPGVTDFVNLIAGSNIENVPTTGTVRIDFDITSWEEIKNTKGEIKFFISPKMFYQKL